MYRDSQYGPTIDLSGPDGNAWVMMGAARNLAKQLGMDGEAITEEMMAGDYDHLIGVFKENFPAVKLLNGPDENWGND